MDNSTDLLKEHPATLENIVDSPISEQWAPVGTFHHIGFVVESISAMAHSFAESMNAKWEGKIIYDPQQKVQVAFLESHSSGNPLVELVEPTEEHSPVFSFLKRGGGGLHHVCFVTDTLEAQLERCRAQGSLIVRQPIAAAAFGGRRIAWVYTKNKLLIEYLERGAYAAHK
jgi:methylmalonyl-CoA/ethylmalonyl-CoA epimerase